MPSGYDVTFADALGRKIRLQLDGNNTEQGLLRQILSCADWDAYLRMRGKIEAYEEVLAMMREVARRMNEGEEPVRARRA
jgi:hypothetical protein